MNKKEWGSMKEALDIAKCPRYKIDYLIRTGKVRIRSLPKLDKVKLYNLHDIRQWISSLKKIEA